MTGRGWEWIPEAWTAERTDAVDRVGITAFYGLTSTQPARQLILSVRRLGDGEGLPWRS